MKKTLKEAVIQVIKENFQYSLSSSEGSGYDVENIHLIIPKITNRNGTPIVGVRYRQLTNLIQKFLETDNEVKEVIQQIVKSKIKEKYRNNKESSRIIDLGFDPQDDNFKKIKNAEEKHITFVRKYFDNIEYSVKLTAEDYVCKKLGLKAKNKSKNTLDTPKDSIFAQNYYGNSSNKLQNSMLNLRDKFNKNGEVIKKGIEHYCSENNFKIVDDKMLEEMLKNIWK